MVDQNAESKLQVVNTKPEENIQYTLEFKNFLVDLSNELDKCDSKYFKREKYRWKDSISDDVHSWLQLLNILYMKGSISETNIDYIQMILRNIRDKKLIEMAMRYFNQRHVSLRGGATNDNPEKKLEIDSDVFANDPYARVLFETAMQDGEEIDNSLRVNIVGTYKQGKTSLLRQLLDQSTVGITSTNGIDVHKCLCLRENDGTLSFKTNEPSEHSYLQRLLGVAMRQQNQQDGACSSVYPDDVASPSGSTDVFGDFNKKLKYDSDLSIEDSFLTGQHDIQTESYQVDSKRKMTKVQNFNNRVPLLTKHEQEHFVATMRTKAPETYVEDNQLTITFWDFGGQFIFYSTHSLFHSKSAVYLLVFDISTPLDQVVEDEEYPSKGETRTMKYYLEFWIHSIQSFVGSDDGSEPVVILVGTHTDKISCTNKTKEEYISEYVSAVRTLFEDSGIILKIHPIDFAIDNSITANENVVALRKTICEVGYKLHKRVRIPAKWLQLEILLDMKKNEKVITLQTVQEIDSSSEFPINDIEQIKLFLRYHHEKGTYIYFDEPSLSDHVILDPQFLVDAFKSIITCERFFANDNEIKPLWKNLLSAAKLEKEFIDMQWSREDHKQLLEKKEVIFAFLIKHHIISEVIRYDDQTETTERLEWYVVPSLLREVSQKDEVEEFLGKRTKTDLKFVMTFKNSILVPMVFNRLLAALVAKWPFVERKNKSMMFHNLCIIVIHKTHAGLAELKGNGIELSVINLLVTSHHVESKSAYIFRRFAEYVVKHEFRKLKQGEQLSVPYSVNFRCNHSDHGLDGSLKTLTEDQLANVRLIPCPDFCEHDIDTASAKDNWFPRVPFSLLEIDCDLTDDKMLSDLAQAIGQNWQMLGLQLNLCQSDLDHIEEDNKSTVMKIYKMLLKWKTMSEYVSFNTLLSVMNKCSNVYFDRDKIDEIRKKYCSPKT